MVTTAPPVPGMGVGPVSGVPTDVLAALFPYYSSMIQTPLEMALAQYQGGNQRDIASMQANASMYNAQTDAQARMAAAQASIEAQRIQSQAALKGIQAQIAADIQRAQGGDRNAAFRLQAEIGLQTQIANQANRLQVAQMASSTGLRDAVAARMFVHGLGPQAQFGSAMMAGPLQEIKPGTVQFQNYGAAPTVDTSVGGGGWSAPSFAAPPSISGGFSGSSGNSLDLNSLMSSSTEVFKNLFGTLGLNTTAPPGAQPITPTPTPAPTIPKPYTPPVGGYAPSPLAAGGPTNAGGTPFIVGGQVLGTLNPDGTVTMNGQTQQPKPGGFGKLPAFAKGGESTGYDAMIVGEKGPEVRMRTPYGEFVAPLSGKFAEGGMVNPVTNYGKSVQNRLYGPKTPAAPPAITNPTPPPAPPAPPSTGTTVSTPDGTTVTTTPPPAAPGMSDVQALPANQALMTGNAPPSSWNANMQFNLPEQGLSNLWGPAQMAHLFRPGATDIQTQMDMISQMQAGLNIPPELIQQIINTFTPGWKPQGMGGPIGF